MKKLVAMREALESPDYFASYLQGESWFPWKVLLIAILGEKLTAEERIVFTMLKGVAAPRAH